MEVIKVNASSSWRQYLTRIDFNSLKDIEENCLENYEKVSLIFLLNEDFSNENICEWAQKEYLHNKNWKPKLLEALAIIQNYQIPKKIGLSKLELNNEFFPLQYFTSKHVNLSRKVIYRVCENLSKKEEITFLNYVKSDFMQKNLEFSTFPQLELYFSNFFKIGYISENNMKNCIDIFYKMELYTHLEMLKFVHKEMLSSTGFSQASAKKNVQEINITDNTKSDPRPPIDIITPSQSESIYETRDNKIALIIDQESFYTAYQPEFKHLLPQGIEREKLKSRKGTTHDSGRLKSILEKRNVKVFVKTNLTHIKIIEELKNRVELNVKEKCSLFFLIILSHGDKGVIYGCNSCRVEVSEIIQILSDKKLEGIPKIVILQSCQGGNLQTMIHSGNDLDIDGPSVRSPEIKKRDFLIFWSTVPGFGSIRNKLSGTWFIQTLCDQIEKHGDSDHFEEICIRTKNVISTMKWEQTENAIFYMVPISESTLTKKIFL